MKKNLEPWSKRVWYVEVLIFMFSCMLIGNIIAFLAINIISIIIVTIISISYKYKESNVLIKPPISDDQTLDTPSLKYVTIHGLQYRVRSNSLKLNNKQIKELSDIKGLDKLWRLKSLDLSHNQLTSTKGFESLVNLRVLKLSFNQIQHLENIKPLQNLKKLILDNNQLKEFREASLPNNLKKIDIAKNPIENFNIYTKYLYDTIHFGPKKWFPKHELKRLKKQIKRMKGKSSTIEVDFTPFLQGFIIWLVITFLLALAINLAFWGAITSALSLNIGYWEFLVTQGLWTFLVGGFGAGVIMLFIYDEL